MLAECANDVSQIIPPRRENESTIGPVVDPGQPSSMIPKLSFPATDGNDFASGAGGRGPVYYLPRTALLLDYAVANLEGRGS